MSSFSDPALIMPGSVDETAHAAASKKDTAGGVAAQESTTGNVVATGSSIKLTRTGANNIYVHERTSNEEALYLNRVAANDYDAFILEGGIGKQIQTESMKNVASGIAGLDTNRDIPHIRPKAASANLRHSHDAEDTSSSITFSKRKTYTFAYGISGTLRVSFDIKNIGSLATVHGRIYKNGVAIGTDQTTTDGNYTTKTEDINFGVLSAGDTIELYARNEDSVETVFVRNFRISYDNATDVILVDGVTNS